MNPLFLQHHPLVDPEPVLLVDDGQGQVGELDPLLHQRVRADHHVHRPAPDPLEDAPTIGRRDRCGEQRVDEPGRSDGRWRFVEQARL